MTARVSRAKRDVNWPAAQVVGLATGDDAVLGKNPAAVALGRLGGIKGGPARAARLNRKERSDIAKKAARARWKKQRKKADGVQP